MTQNHFSMGSSPISTTKISIFVVGIVRPVLESPIVDNQGLAAQLGENLRPLSESMSEWQAVLGNLPVMQNDGASVVGPSPT